MEQESRLDPPLVSTEDDFTPIPITDLLQSWTISASPLPIHLSTTILPIHQYLPIQCQSITNTSGQRIRIQGTRSLLGPTILVLTEDDFTPIPKTPILSQTCTNLSTHHQSTTSTIQCQCANQLPIQCQYNANTTRQMCSYLREQVSMGTHRWSRRRTISL